LAEAMGDVEDRFAFRAQPAQRGENPLDLAVAQRGGRLVEDEHAGMPRQHARDLDELTLADAEARHRRCQRNPLHAELIEGAARRLAQMAAAMEQRDLAVAEPDIVLDRERRRERELLRDERDAKRLRLERMADVVPGAVDAHAAGIGAIDAGQKLDERALAGAVLAADRVNLAGAE